MTETVQKEAAASLLSRLISACRDPAARIRTVDLLTMTIAVLLPWSTTGVSIGAGLWLIAFVFTVDPRDFLASLRRPASALPLAFVVLVLLGLLWSEGPPPDRMHQLSQVAKLLVLPLLIYHFGRSSRGMAVFTAFLISCAVLSLVSCLVALDPRCRPRLISRAEHSRRPAASLSATISTRARSFRCARWRWPILR